MCPEGLANLGAPPKELTYLWKWSMDMGKFEWERVSSWARMRNIHLTQWQLDALVRLDRIKCSG